jgi:uncharacterized protein YeeX (DUF496 family)
MKTKRLFYKICTILILCGCLNACFRLKEVKIDQESKDYCLFEQGSYWIYQDSATLKIDSVAIDKAPRYSTYQEDGYLGEQYKFTEAHYSHDSTWTYWLILVAGMYDNYTILIGQLSREISYHNRRTGENVNRTVLSENKNNFILNGIIYSNVKIFIFSHKEFKLVYYWAKNIGLIREERYINDSVTVRNLIRYNAKPYKQ